MTDMCTKLNLSIIIVNYNSTRELKDCIESIFQTVVRLSFELIIVDNNSSDQDSLMNMLKNYSSLKLIMSDWNYGFAGGNNLAMQKARGSVLLFLNPDTIVLGDAVEKMYDFITSREDIGMVGPLIINDSNDIDLYCARRSPDIWTELFDHSGLSRIFKRSKIFGRYRMTYWDHRTTREIELIAGSCMMVKRQLVETVGYMDERFFLYGDDVEWCYRFRKLGYKIFFYPSAQIIHKGGRSTHSQKKATSLIGLNSMYKFFKFHHNKGIAVVYRIIILCVYAMKSIFCWFTPRRTNFFTYCNMVLWAVGALKFEQDRHGNPTWRGVNS